jgi:internalin A
MSSDTKSLKPIKIFISCSSKDEELKKKLLTHLSPMIRQGMIESWDERQIRAGSEWNSTMLHHLNEASIILCLISSDFIASDSCYLIESQRALERRVPGEVEVIPILLKATDWKNTVFRPLQVIPRSGKAIAGSRNRERTLSDVAQEIGKVVDILRK